MLWIVGSGPFLDGLRVKASREEDGRQGSANTLRVKRFRV